MHMAVMCAWQPYVCGSHVCVAALYVWWSGAHDNLVNMIAMCMWWPCTRDDHVCDNLLHIAAMCIM